MPLPSITNPSNFRDLAAHAGPEPRLRRRVLFRSDHLGALDENDARQIQALGIRRVLDFRGVDERTAAACMLPDVTVHSLAIEPTIVQQIKGFTEGGRQITSQDVVGLMQDTYRGFVRGSTHRFAEFFAHLLESDDPTVFHCTAGKDRTGFAAALVLRALGVPQDDVMRDYLLTNERLKAPANGLWGLPPEAVSVLYRVQPDFLQASLDAVEADYGGLEAYFREGLGLGEPERQRLRELYLAR
ncbi:MAG: tyrosine-protein phosphatase [Pseudomonadota bacterium]